MRQAKNGQTELHQGIRMTDVLTSPPHTTPLAHHRPRTRPPSLRYYLIIDCDPMASVSYRSLPNPFPTCPVTQRSRCRTWACSRPCCPHWGGPARGRAPTPPFPNDLGRLQVQQRDRRCPSLSTLWLGCFEWVPGSCDHRCKQRSGHRSRCMSACSQPI